MNLKRIKDSFIYVTPNFNDSETVRYKLKITSLILWCFIYTIGVTLITILILGITPMKNLIYHFENEELKVQSVKTVELENKIIFLTKELESISSANKKLEYAFILATSDSIDSTSAIYDSLKYESKKNLPYGGNLFFIFSKIFNEINKDENILYFVKPSKGLVINKFNTKEGHFGVDYAVSTGSPIFASQGGIVLFADFTIDDGYKIMLQHENGFITVYKHCSNLLKKERDVVVLGELIGLSGNSGKNTTGPHLHFEIWQDGKPRNPKELFIK